MMFDPFFSVVYTLRLHYYTKDGKNARRVNRFYHRLLNKGKGDAVIKTHTNGQRLLCNFAHQLPFYQKEFPLYDRQLSRLCQFLHEELKRTLNIIDVGANVGDTVMNIGLKDAFYLCVEGNERYTKFIRRNLHRYEYILENCYLTESMNQTSYSVETANGTARLVSSENGGIVSMMTLDKIVFSKYSNVRFDLLKVDTDGFDYQILRGGTKLLGQRTPLVFFEWDRELWEAQGERPLEVMSFLAGLGYDKCILFDNFGCFFDVTSTSDLELLSQYLKNTHGDGLPYYYDVLALHNSLDLELRQRICELFNTTTK